MRHQSLSSKHNATSVSISVPYRHFQIVRAKQNLPPGPAGPPELPPPPPPLFRSSAIRAARIACSSSSSIVAFCAKCLSEKGEEEEVLVLELERTRVRQQKLKAQIATQRVHESVCVRYPKFFIPTLASHPCSALHAQCSMLYDTAL